MILDVCIASNLTFDHRALPSVAWEQITAALTTPNPARAKAIKEHLQGAHRFPKEIRLWQEGRLPRGFARQLEEGLQAFRVDVVWNDWRSRASIDTARWSLVPLRSYQEEAVQEMLRNTEGIYKAESGSGKTVAFLEFMRRAQQKSLVIVDKTNIAQQWKERANQWLNFDPGIVGDGEFEIKDITIALQQTLWSRRDELPKDFWKSFGIVCLDECHKFPAETFTDTLQRFSSYYRLGISATPYLHEELTEVINICLGSVFHTTSSEALVDAGVVLKPEIRIVHTDFDFSYFPTHEHERGTKCLYDGCEGGRHTKFHRNNYTAMMLALVDDDDRNQLIAEDVARQLESESACLVISRNLSHLRNIRNKVAELSDADLFMFIGERDSEERMKIAHRADEGNCVLFSTIADEALDIPRLDSIFLTWPTRNTSLVQQQIGRVRRTHPEKARAVVFDYADSVGVLHSQLLDRKRRLYAPAGFEVREIRPRLGVPL